MLLHVIEFVGVNATVPLDMLPPGGGSMAGVFQPPAKKKASHLAAAPYQPVHLTA